MNIAELLKLIQQVETGKVIKIINETTEQVSELHDTIFSGNIGTIKMIGLIIIILMSGIGLIEKAAGDFDLSSILQHVVFTVIIATIFNMSTDVIFKETGISPEKQMTTVQKEVEEEATSKEIESWKQKILADIKNHRQNKNAKIPIKTINIAKNYLYYIRHNSKENEM